ncbi:MAG: hypothetical protein WA440_01730 [Ignavibacteriaceae bacterium]
MARRKHKTFGNCQICERYKKLTDDHVPPQGGIEVDAVEIKSAFNFFTKRFGNKNYFISQNGVKFTTICECCNSRLGREYDTVLNTFSLDVNRFLTSKLSLLNSYNIETKPNRLIRGVLVHLLATKSEIERTPFDNKVREILFDGSKPIPDDINVFYWIYPYKLTIIIRDILMPAVRGRYNDFGFFQIFKYYPIAYLVVNKSNYSNLPSLRDYNSAKIDTVAEINIRINERKHWKWPEIVEDGNFVFLGRAGTEAIKAEKHIKGKKV